MSNASWAAQGYKHLPACPVVWAAGVICFIRIRRPLPPRRMPVAVLNCYEDALDRPCKVFPKLRRVPVPPVGPRVLPRGALFRRLPHRKPRGLERPMVVGEREAVIRLRHRSRRYCGPVGGVPGARVPCGGRLRRRRLLRPGSARSAHRSHPYDARHAGTMSSRRRTRACTPARKRSASARPVRRTYAAAPTRH